MLAVLMISSLLNIAYLLPIPVRAFFGTTDDGSRTDGIKEAPLACVIALSISALGCLVLFVYPEPFYRLMNVMISN